MARVDVEQEPGAAASPARQAEIMVGVPGLVDALQLRSLAAQWQNPEQQITVIYPSLPGMGAPSTEESGPVRLVARELAVASSADLPWLGQPHIYGELLAEAESLGARACVFINPDLMAFTPAYVEALARPLLEGEFELALSSYPPGRYGGLLNQAIIAPTMRALYGRRVHNPLAQDFGVSAAFGSALRQSIGSGVNAQSVLWPVTETVIRDRKICQVHLPVHHEYTSLNIDLPSLLQLLLGPLFSDVDRHASLWQRIRGSHATAEFGTPILESEPAGESAPDPRPMCEAFQLGQRNLLEIWSLVLPPITLLELKKLSRQPLESFRMDDTLWARIIYDFALAYRLRTLARNHLLGALAPLYLGWVGSRVLEMQASTSVGARQEQLERAFEQSKPYLVQRWRWPDRFNP